MPGISSNVVGVSCSFVLHLGAIALVAAGGGAPAVPRAPQVAEGSAPLPVTIVYQPSAVVVPVTVPAPVPPSRSRVGIGRTPRRVPSVAASVLPVPPDPPPPPVAEAAAPLPPPALASSMIPVVMHVGPRGPVRVSPDQAKALRYHDVYPSLPDAARLSGTRLVVMVDVCVSTLGVVDEVSFARGTSHLLVQLLRPAISEWRYHPLQLQGAATPFCHLVRLEYRVP